MLRWQYMLLVLTAVTGSALLLVENKISFDNELLNRLWNDENILGNSTQFKYPVDAGTTTACDRELYSKIFTASMALNQNYSEWDENWSISQRAPRYFFKGYAFRGKTQPVRKIEKEIYSNLTCIHACITEKDFECRSVVYFHGDGGVCALYDVSGYYKAGDPHYVSVQESSDHWKIFKRDEEFPVCDVPKEEFAHNYFALGWKSMEAGWFTLANNQLDKAIALDPDFYMAHVGKVLSHPDLGYGLKHENGTSYGDVLKNFMTRPDWKIKLAFQQRLIYRAVIALLEGTDLNDGLLRMQKTFTDDTTTTEDYMIKVLDANCQLLTSDPVSPNRLASQAKADKKVFALRYLTYNLNPYRKSGNKTLDTTRDAAVAAVHTFQQLQIKGASHILADCIDITEYYGEFNLAYGMLDIQRTFLFQEIAPNRLYKEVSGRIVMGVDRVNIDLIGVAQKVTAENERFHFSQVQTLRLVGAIKFISGIDEESAAPELIPIYRRMVANHYFSLYDFYSEKYASMVNFTANIEDDFNNAGTPLEKVSYAYYWTAAAISDMRSPGGRKRRAVHEDVMTKIALLKQENFQREGYKILVEIYEAVILGYQAFVRGEYDTASNQARIAGRLNEDLLEKSNFSMAGDDYSEQFKLLLPLGAQFKADMLRQIYFTTDNGLAEGTVDASIVRAAYKEVTEMAPLNTTRAQLGYAYALIEENKNKPKTDEEETPEGIRVLEDLRDKRWINTDIPKKENELKDSVSATVQDYYEAEVVGCRAAEFQIKSIGGDGQTVICWGGFVVIGVCIAIVVIIAIIVGILCLRRKATAPARDKDKEEGFVFTGPNLNCSESGIGTPSYQMGSLGRDSHISDGPYMSQTLDMKRNLSNSDYTQRSNTLGAEKLYLNGSHGAQL